MRGCIVTCSKPREKSFESSYLFAEGAVISEKNNTKQTKKERNKQQQPPDKQTNKQKSNKVERTAKAEIRKLKFLAVNVASEAIF